MDELRSQSKRITTLYSRGTVITLKPGPIKNPEKRATEVRTAYPGESNRVSIITSAFIARTYTTFEAVERIFLRGKIGIINMQ